MMNNTTTKNNNKNGKKMQASKNTSKNPEEVPIPVANNTPFVDPGVTQNGVDKSSNAANILEDLYRDIQMNQDQRLLGDAHKGHSEQDMAQDGQNSMGNTNANTSSLLMCTDDPIKGTATTEPPPAQATPSEIPTNGYPSHGFTTVSKGKGKSIGGISAPVYTTGHWGMAKSSNLISFLRKPPPPSQPAPTSQLLARDPITNMELDPKIVTPSVSSLAAEHTGSPPTGETKGAGNPQARKCPRTDDTSRIGEGSMPTPASQAAYTVTGSLPQHNNAPPPPPATPVAATPPPNTAAPLAPLAINAPPAAPIVNAPPTRNGQVVNVPFQFNINLPNNGAFQANQTFGPVLAPPPGGFPHIYGFNTENLHQHQSQGHRLEWNTEFNRRGGMILRPHNGIQNQRQQETAVASARAALRDALPLHRKPIVAYTDPEPTSTFIPEALFVTDLTPADTQFLWTNDTINTPHGTFHIHEYDTPPSPFLTTVEGLTFPIDRQNEVLQLVHFTVARNPTFTNFLTQHCNAVPAQFATANDVITVVLNTVQVEPLIMGEAGG
ncbi:hypothetical protein GYMLUDRAFT_65005 [Collybiopsis luxurians FD-317 M1]|uniref:Uncharacterized protein n=1 Tax=Collybiopsis luxurians FD-317 M1 TaxID=944289 RepID=A0A0D0ALL6_9AGAR|nr:hypothetical protein GYMLUDRAFT_65005 [Collybiopsis luxurians FD-317 M1]